MSVQHFLTLLDLPRADVLGIVERAIELKRDPSLAGSQARKTLGLIFEKSSTRTRAAFEVAMTQMQGASLFLATSDSQLGRGEPISDTAQVLSRMVDCLAIRTFEHAKLEQFAAHSQVPIINALSDDFHPCQLLADMQTFIEHRGAISGRRVAWIGDGNNMCQSYINAAAVFDFELLIACPPEFEPKAELVSAGGERVSVLHDPKQAVKDVDLVVTDVWASMGQEAEQLKRQQAFADYEVTPDLMALANSDALFMHCLPAHRGEEVSAQVLDAPDSVVWDEAENRMHSQKALLETLLAH
ncbi:MAG: ornithine carbamoyltransferase [Gammaproteobacteria bacterium]|jgi:ornithine carbamoyltransferase|nr:ornithine carbamoyltransferase [Gammaproteobacteria bacterium]HJN96293.1 ornithine carbamoyltransferase [Gammaproteobacteria bacterium]|tara:strand:+ start:689 stop:1585 length:897 start_codon:yes stop_codon:yes gene_type:complete